MMRAWSLWMCALLAALAAACEGAPCLSGEVLTPGRGAAAAGVALCLDMSQAAAERACAAPQTSDLGAAGVRVSCPEQHLEAWLRELDDGLVIVAVSALDGFAGRTAAGLGLGSTRAEVEALLGPPRSVEPFSGAWRYPSQGISFVFAADAVSGIAVFAPRGG